MNQNKEIIGNIGLKWLGINYLFFAKNKQDLTLRVDALCRYYYLYITNWRVMEQLKNILMRIVATFAASGLGVVGAGTIAGVPLIKAVFMAGIAGVATVIEGLSRAFLDDGKLSLKEINEVFNQVDKKAKKAAE